jgi:Fe-S oxidoreductase
MPLPTRDVIGILADNLRLRRSVLPITSRSAMRWARSLNLPHGGDTVLYTGLMYQLIPYIEGLVKAEKGLGDTWLSKLAPLARQINRVINVSTFMVWPRGKLKAEFDSVPINVAKLLSQAGVDFGYLYKDDLYSGALAHDLGSDEVVARHAQHVYSVFKKHGVKTLITIDPHTTNMLRSVYPKLIPGYDIEVKNYLEVLVEKGLTAKTMLSGDIVIHDPCVFARYEGMVDEPRTLLAAAGLTIHEPEKSGRMTWCCGGPVESLYPLKALENAKKRVGQLREAGTQVVTMCPMCFVNLSDAASADVQISDISQYLHRAFVS